MSKASGSRLPTPAAQRAPGSPTASRRPSPHREAARPSRIRRWTLPAIFLVVGIAAIGVLTLNLRSPSAAEGAKAQRPVLGDKAAPVEIHEYADFQCPSCGAFARTIEPQVRASYIESGKARLIWHDFAWIGAESRDAANAARCAGDQGKFWEYHDLLYANQSGENAGAFSKDRLKGFGASLGLEATTFHACVDAGTYAAAVQADFDDVRDKGFNGTPTFVIGNQTIVGAQPFEVFAAAIDAALAKQ